MMEGDMREIVLQRLEQRLKEKDEEISSPYGAISKQLYHNANVKKVDKNRLFKVEIK